MIGAVAYANASRRFALLTPVGKTRSHDIFAQEIWFHLAGIGFPIVGTIVEFEVSANRDGVVEAVNLKQFDLATTAAGVKKTLRPCGADTAGGELCPSPPPAEGT